MNWKTGSDLFIEMWKLIEKHIPEEEHRIDFTARLLTIRSYAVETLLIKPLLKTDDLRQ